LDLPGYGRSEKVDIPREDFLHEILPVLGLEKPVVVAPSMSGGYAFPFLIDHPGSAAGFVAVAPAGIHEYDAQLGQVRVPTLVVWGDNDSIIPLSLGEVLRKKIDGSKLIVLENARHPSYLDRPEEFHVALIDFLRSLAVD
jgi:abhydrolase domain-containing protein 14